MGSELFLAFSANIIVFLTKWQKLWLLMLWRIGPVQLKRDITSLQVLWSHRRGTVQMFFKEFKAQRDWFICTITTLLIFSTTLVPVVFRSVVTLVLKMIYLIYVLYGWAVADKQSYYCLYCAFQMLSLLSLTVLSIGCIVGAIWPNTVAIFSAAL